MGLSIGIVGLPNVGKSTLFRALTKLNILVANYPFATIEPNSGVVPIKDERLDKLSEISKSTEKIYATIEFKDIAGLVRGASKGEGLGNKFLGHIKEADAIVQVVRVFNDTNITHVQDSVDPKRDIQIINTELILKDMETIQSYLPKFQKILSSSKKIEDKNKLEILNRSLELLNKANLLSKVLTKEEIDIVKDLNLITCKPMIFIANIDDSEIGKQVDLLKQEIGLEDDDILIPLNIKLEDELAELTEEEAKEYLQSVGQNETGLNILAKTAFNKLGLINFFTTGEKESRAWTIKKDTNAKEGVGIIHTDFSKNFISLEVIKYNDFIQFGNWQSCKEMGKVHLQGRDYIIEDGDVVVVRHNSK